MAVKMEKEKKTHTAVTTSTKHTTGKLSDQQRRKEARFYGPCTAKHSE